MQGQVLAPVERPDRKELTSLLSAVRSLVLAILSCISAPPNGSMRQVLLVVKGFRVTLPCILLLPRSVTLVLLKC